MNYQTELTRNQGQSTVHFGGAQVSLRSVCISFDKSTGWDNQRHILNSESVRADKHHVTLSQESQNIKGTLTTVKHWSPIDMRNWFSKQPSHPVLNSTSMDFKKTIY